MYEKLESCPICSNNSLHNEHIIVDRLITEESFILTKCNSCGFLFTNPRPDSDNIGKYYNSEEYVSHQKRSSNLTDRIYRVARFFTLKNKRKLIEKYNAPGSILDFGCGTGEFLKKCSRSGWNIFGVEPDAGARSIASGLTGCDISENLDELLDQDFDVITLWHVLEHLHDPLGAMKKFKKLLRSSGTLIVAVPNHESWDAKYYKDDWAGWDVPRHLSHFTQKSMNRLAKTAGMKVTETLPMKLDAYYVSLLSEKYRGRKQPYASAFRKGKKSNNEAKQNNNYSSLIYIIKP